MRPQESTLAEELRGAGYVTGMFGKWHLSKLNSDQPQPHDQGFDYWFACDNNLGKLNPVALIRNGVEVGRTKGWASQVVADEAIGWMKKQKPPFFAYVAFSETHSPVDSPKELSDKYEASGDTGKRAKYKGMVEYSDKSVGTLLNALDEMAVADNTFVFLALLLDFTLR